MTHPSLWVREAEPVDGTRDPLPKQADVVIVGGGVAGASAALALARADVEVVLLERGAIAERASGRNDGQVLLGLGEHYNRIVGQFGEADARLLWDYIHANNQRVEREVEDLGIDCGFARAGGLRLAETTHERDELTHAAALMQAESLEHELLDVDAVRELLPASEGFFGALRLPGEAVVQPARLVRGLARGAIAAGARVLQGCGVASIESCPDGGHVVRTAAGDTVSCAMVVHCTSALATELDDTGFLAAQVFPFRGQIIATDALPNDVAAQFGDFAMSSNFCYEYFRAHHGRFVIGGMRWSVPGEEQGIVDDTTTNDDVSANLIGFVERHFPVLRGVEFPHTWTGIMAGTGDGLPLLGPLPARTDAFALLGFNGYGLSFACEAGVSLAEQIVDGRASHAAAALFAPRRFR